MNSVAVVSNLMDSLKYLGPNLAMAIGSLVLLMAGLWIRSSCVLTILTSLILVTAAALNIPNLGLLSTQYFSGLVYHDAFSSFFGFIIPFIILFAVVMGHYSKELLADRKAEYMSLLLAFGCGLLFMSSSNHFLMAYLGIEMVSVLSYALAGFHRERQSSVEASMKYIVYGALATGIMIFGMSLMYAVSGELTISGMRNFVHSVPADAIPYLFWVGVIFSFAGFGYKISAAPMHMWTPDVYEGSPTPVAALFSVAPKAAGFALLIRFFVVGLSLPVVDQDLVLFATKNATQPAYLAGGLVSWAKFFAISSVFTMFMGNLAALGQTSVKRILAYSSIAHAGYMLLGLTSQNREGLSAIMFYIVVYCTMNLGAFWVASLVEDRMGGDSLKDFKGLAKKAPLLAVLMAIFLFSLVGLPPFVGFIGKLYLFIAILGQKMYGLALLAGVNSVISLFYYAKILKAMFLEKVSEETLNIQGQIPKFILVMLFVLAVPNLVFGLYWEPLMSWAMTSLDFAR